MSDVAVIRVFERICGDGAVVHVFECIYGAGTSCTCSSALGCWTLTHVFECIIMVDCVVWGTFVL